MKMLLVGIAVAVLGLQDATAQTYPARTVRIVVPATPGGAIDLIARTLAEKLTTSLGQPVVVENKPGASNNLGTDFVAKSPPDGYTLVIVASSHATNKHLFKQMPFDPIKDFEPVVYTHVVPLLLAVHPSVPREDRPRAGELDQGESRQGDLRVERSGQLAAHGGRALHEHDRARRCTTCPTRAARRRIPTCSRDAPR